MVHRKHHAYLQPYSKTLTLFTHPYLIKMDCSSTWEILPWLLANQPVLLVIMWCLSCMRKKYIYLDVFQCWQLNKERHYRLVGSSEKFFDMYGIETAEKLLHHQVCWNPIWIFPSCEQKKIMLKKCRISCFFYYCFFFLNSWNRKIIKKLL